MATERLPMRKIREILRYKWALGAEPPRGGGQPGRERRRGLAGRAPGPRRRARLADGRSARRRGARGAALRRQRRASGGARCPIRSWMHTERKKPGVTLELLHHEYREQHPDGYGYTQFCEHYRQLVRGPPAVDAPGASRRREAVRRLRRQEAAPDRSGDRARCTRSSCSSRCSAPRTSPTPRRARRQQIADWIASHVRAFEYLGGVTGAVVPDQLKTGVTRACRYEPEIQRTYEELARHYGTVILPARPASPRDKAKVEVGVQIAERWILARLRHQTFFTLHALNQRIAELRRGAQRPHHAALRREPPRAVRAARPAGAASPCPSAATSMRRGSSCARASTTTSSSTATTTACRSRCGTSGWTCGTPPRPSRSSTRASVSPSHAQSSCPRSSHDRARAHAQGAPGAPRVVAGAPDRAGRRASARTPARWSRRSSPTGRTPSRAIAPASGSCGSASATATSGSSRGRPRARSRAPSRTATSTRSSSTASTGCPPRTIARATRCRRRARERARAATTTDEEEPPHDRCLDPREAQALRLDAMAAAWQEQQRHADHDALTFDERFGMLVDAEWLARENRRRAARAAGGQAAAHPGQPRGHRLPGPSARSTRALAAPARHLPLDRRAPQRRHHRRDRHRQDVHRLRARAPGLPHRLPRALSPPAAPVRGTHARPRRRHLRRGCSPASPASTCS